MRKPLLMFALVASLVAAPGCAGTRRETFRIVVKNQTPEPITIGLAKVGQPYGRPYEELWASPEEAAVESTGPAAGRWGVVVEPGKTATAGPVEGSFERTSRGTLRVYSGARSLTQVVAVSRGHPWRLDLPLRPGDNAFTIREVRGKLTADQGIAEPAEAAGGPGDTRPAPAR